MSKPWFLQNCCWDRVKLTLGCFLLPVFICTSFPPLRGEAGPAAEGEGEDDTATGLRGVYWEAAIHYEGRIWSCHRQTAETIGFTGGKVRSSAELNSSYSYNCRRSCSLWMLGRLTDPCSPTTECFKTVRSKCGAPSKIKFQQMLRRRRFSTQRCLKKSRSLQQRALNSWKRNPTCNAKRVNSVLKYKTWRGTATQLARTSSNSRRYDVCIEGT